MEFIRDRNREFHEGEPIAIGIYPVEIAARNFYSGENIRFHSGLTV